MWVCVYRYTAVLQELFPDQRSETSVCVARHIRHYDCVIDESWEVRAHRGQVTAVRQPYEQTKRQICFTVLVTLLENISVCCHIIKIHRVHSWIKLKLCLGLYSTYSHRTLWRWSDSSCCHKEASRELWRKNDILSPPSSSSSHGIRQPGPPNKFRISCVN